MFMSREFVRQIKKKQSPVVWYTRRVHLTSGKEATINKVLNTTINERACVGSVCGGTFCEERSFCPFTPILENFIPP